MSKDNWRNHFEVKTIASPSECIVASTLMENSMDLVYNHIETEDELLERIKIFIEKFKPIMPVLLKEKKV